MSMVESLADLSDRDMVSVTVARETHGRRARTLTEVLASGRPGRRAFPRFSRRNGVPIPSVGMESTVRVDRSTYGKLSKVWDYVAVGRTHRYAVVLPKRPGDAVAGAALNDLENRQTLLKRRFDFHAEPFLQAMDAVGTVHVRREFRMTEGVGAAAPAPPNPDEYTVIPVESLNMAFVDVPIGKRADFETSMNAAGARFHRVPSLPVQFNLPRLPKPVRLGGAPGGAATLPAAAPAGGPEAEPAGAPRPGGAGHAGVAAATTIRLGAVDTGLSLACPEFAGRESSIQFAVFDKEGRYAVTAPTDDHGHGTCVLSRATGSVCGIVPNASLVVAAAMPNLKGEIVQITEALGWVIAQEHVGVVNLSLVATDFFGRAVYRDVFRQAVETAEGLGIYIVAATGNDGPGRVGAPGAYQIVQAVGATDGRGAFWEHSGHGLVVEEPGIYKPNWIAHGQALQAVLQVPVGHMGTSYACPVVSGIVLRALINGLDPLDELTRSSDPIAIGRGRHLGHVRRIRWPEPGAGA